MIDVEHCYSGQRTHGEKNDCTVRACAVATQIDYSAMREYLSHYGRKPKRGMNRSDYHRALRDLGFEIIELDGPKFEYRTEVVEGFYRFNWKSGREVWIDPHFRCTQRKVSGGKHYDSVTVMKLAKELNTGTYLVGTDSHVLCLKDGVVHDHTKGRKFRVKSVHRVIESPCAE